MSFAHRYGLTDLPPNATVHERTAVRAVVMRDGKLLMIHNNLGDYYFPGGGVDKNETHEQALRREVLEETGYVVTFVGDWLGEATYIGADMYDPSTYFVMMSHYFVCEVGACAGALKLDDYERDLEYVTCWVAAEEAIANNEKVMHRPEDMFQRAVVRDTQVLKEVTGL